MLRTIPFILAALLLSTGAYAQTSATSSDSNTASLWADYESRSAEFAELYSRSADVDPLATAGNRLYRQTIASGERFVHTLQSLLEPQSGLLGEDRVRIVDNLLTTQQVIGSFYVEIEECQAGKTALEEALAHPGMSERINVEAAAEDWLSRADACLSEQAAEEARREREQQIAELQRQIDEEGDNARAAQLRAELAELEGADYLAPAEPRGPINIAPVVVMVAGVAVLGGAIGWDASLADERDTLDQFRDSDDFDERNAAVDAAATIDDAKVPVAVLYGVGAAATLTGIVWLAVNPRRNIEDQPEESVSFNPTLLRGGAGFSVRARF